jgi:hypothetical protein
MGPETGVSKVEHGENVKKQWFSSELEIEIQV